ncbi:hypothetical protein L1987_63629 [Smallanthus sonchifolius]|uniref:Uncharacterized protein n=1 Tax=Smallanthus sonchifolius TaxID=185202 RepID=A0ACB9CDT5_9ASTR|nr:hypothetical protein L1987_63629 [Smallanthus sonchifolius]
MEGSKSNPRQQGDQDQISQSPQDYTNLDGDENQDVPQDQNVNEDASVEDENRGGEEDAQLKSTVWGDFIEVTLDFECIHRKTISTGRPTSTWKRHMDDGCLKRKQYLRTQQLLNFQPLDTANPMFERLSRTTIKADCFKVYEKKLKALVK